MNKVTIGILRETKIPVDNRVPFTPTSIARIKELYPNIRFIVESSDVRAFKDAEYEAVGCEMVRDLVPSACDLMFGVKEVALDHLHPYGHYVFFSHIAKEQPYNRELANRMHELGITLTDYEYLVNHEGKRIVAFGFWAGVVGCYNTLRLAGLKSRKYTLPEANPNTFTLDELEKAIKENAKAIRESHMRILITGTGNVSEGAQYVLHQLVGMISVHVDVFKHVVDRYGSYYAVAGTKDLVKSKFGDGYKRESFHSHPERYCSRFDEFAPKTDVLICCHSWEPGMPEYLTPELAFSDKSAIKIVGDITCDIRGSICTTLRPSTHADPFYGVRMEKTVRHTEDGMVEEERRRLEECAAWCPDCISVMAVDTCPNAIPRESSEDFSHQLEMSIVTWMAHKNDPENPCRYAQQQIDDATILREGVVTEKFAYLEDFVYNG